jgi:hypothetical protein
VNGSTTITVVQVTTTRSALGVETYETTEQDVADVMFEPLAPSERPDDAGAPKTVVRGKFYLPVALQLNADDLVLHDGYEWRVEGGSQVWVDQTEVAAVRAGAFG